MLTSDHMLLRLVTAVLAFSASAMSAAVCTLNCPNVASCIQCVGKTAVAGGVAWNVTMDASSCKGGDTLSWMCCKGVSIDGTFDPVACDVGWCDGSIDGNKCDEVTQLSVVVPAGAQNIMLQVHDGRIVGNKSCNTKGECCGGAGTSCEGAMSGVCEMTLDLASCPITGGGGGGGIRAGGPRECFGSPDCYELYGELGACGYYECEPDEGLCIVRTSEAGVECRSVAGDCDVVEVCNGADMDCPEDSFLTSASICREAAGDCDSEERCTGTSPYCGEDIKLGGDTVCRGVDGDCDIEERCDGVVDDCPSDAFLPSTTVCREAAGVCDAPEHCSGTDAQCVTDELHPQGWECRGQTDPCDVTEKCDGASVHCPQDARRDKGHSFKCGRVCYVCAVQPEFVLLSRRTTSIGNCNMGSCDNIVYLTWPDCVDQCIAGVCPNQKALSNAELHSCIPASGIWTCTQKIDVNGNTTLPVCRT